jgi:trehalose synthase
MLRQLESLLGNEVMDELRVLASRVSHLKIQNVNSTPVGGGVAEILTKMIPLMRELGVDATWDVIKGDQKFFNVTKAFHNALHGSPETITE